MGGFKPTDQPHNKMSETEGRSDENSAPFHCIEAKNVLEIHRMCYHKLQLKENGLCIDQVIYFANKFLDNSWSSLFF